jgi:hypothetical protein
MFVLLVLITQGNNKISTRETQTWEAFPAPLEAKSQDIAKTSFFLSSPIMLPMKAVTLFRYFQFKKKLRRPSYGLHEPYEFPNFWERIRKTM